MHYNMKNFLTTSALALVLSFSVVNLSAAQGVVRLNDDAKASDNADEIPDEISLFGDDDSIELGVITPAKSASGVDKKAASNVKSASTLKTTKTVKTVTTTTTTGVKPASTLKDNVKSVTTTTTVNKTTGGVKSAAELLKNAKTAQEANNKDANAPKDAALLLSADADKKSPLAAEKPAAAQNIPAVEKAAKAVSIAAPAGGFDNTILKDVDDTVFQQMSDLEKQTAILNLELKKEQVKSNIESLKAVQEKARQEEQARKDEEKRKIQEWENEQKRKLMQEEQKLKQLEIDFEELRQEKLLNSYKNKMLEDTQKFIAEREDTFKKLDELKKERQGLVSDFKGRFLQLTKLADEATSNAIRVRDEYAKTISDLQTQISILKARLEASEQKNPFAQDGASTENSVDEVKLSDIYAVMEVRGQGDVLTAKLINESGVPFLVKVGTALQSGHIIDEITPTYVRAEKNGKKDYLYFSAGGILDKEPIQHEELSIKVAPTKDKKAKQGTAVISNGIPGLASEMTIR